MNSTHFERAIFISWYCSKRDCKFCYLSSNPNMSQDPKKDRRTLASIFAEAIICKACGWKVEFLSGGCDTYTDKELLNIIKTIYKITKQKQWLNIGTLNKQQLTLFKPYIEGVCGTVECISPKLRDEICPSKPLKEIEEMFKIADQLNLKKTITIIIGLGETIGDFKHLKDFIKKHKLKKITFYRLKPQKGTIYENKQGPKTKYYVEWIKQTRKAFPKIEIVAGSWLTHLDEIHLLLEAGANSITKFPSIKNFNSKYARQIEQECQKAKRIFKGTLTKLPKIKELNSLNLNKTLKEQINIRLNNYLKRMKKPKQ
ncbi:MAG: radical SAM protein [Nanoarchaeota archaeon]|nr:radical SAM protein [Nanoarchaeota archaeon]